jgi:thiosulfate/3-mercaptopyruvate sulfurtransferase
MKGNAVTHASLVSTEWLGAHLSQPDLVLFDATKFLPPSAKDGHREFLAAHIPGARYFDVDAIADPDTDLPHMVPSPGRFARMVGALGVGNASHVVFYDQNSMMWAARGWWMMRLFGHDRASVLDGGLPKWQREGRPTEAGEPSPPTPQTFRPDFRATRLRGIGDMLSNVASGGELVLDARSAARFTGQAPELRPGLRSGHIPGSRNLPYAELLTPEGTLLPAETLRARLAAAGADGKRPVTTSCGSGVSATLITLALNVAGLPEGAVYDGSWTEWGGRADTPVET